MAERCGRDAPELGITDCGLAKPCPYHDAPLAPIENEREDIDAFHEEPEGPAPEWLGALVRVSGLRYRRPYTKGKRHQFLVIPAENERAREALHDGAYPVDLGTEDGSDDATGWVYRVREPRREIGRLQRTPEALGQAVHRVLSVGLLEDKPGELGAELWRESVLHLVGLAMEAGTRRQRAAADHVRRRKLTRLRYATGLGDGGDPGEVTIFDTIEGDDGKTTLDVTVRCFVTCRGRGEDMELEAEDFEAEVDGVKLPDKVTEHLAESRRWADMACEFDTPWGWIEPGIYRHDTLGRFEVLGAFKEPGVCTGLVVARPLRHDGVAAGRWRLVDLAPWLHEEMKPEREAAKPGELAAFNTVPTPAPDTQAGPWCRVGSLLSEATSDLLYGRRREEQMDAWPALREAADIAYREGVAEEARREAARARPVLWSYEVDRLLKLIPDTDDNRRARMVIEALGPSDAFAEVDGTACPAGVGRLARFHDVEVRLLHRLLQRADTDDAQVAAAIGEKLGTVP